MSEPEIRDFDADRDADGVDALWGRAFGPARGGQTPRWLFRPGPAGPHPRSVAVADGHVVAHAGVMALPFTVEGEVVRGGYSVGAMTHPDWRGRRLFYRVGEHLYRRMEEEGFAFVAGFSNRASASLMTGPLGRTPIRPFPFCVHPLPPWRAQADTAPSAAGDLRIREATPDDPALDVVWRAAAPAVRVGAVRDGAYARWRLLGHPKARYDVLLAERAGRPAAWAATRGLALRGVAAVFLVELVVGVNEEPAARLLLRRLHRAARVQGARLASALLPAPGPARTALRRAGYLRVPELLHPQLIRYSVRPLGADATRARALVDPRAWTLAWGDTDVV